MRLFFLTIFGIAFGYLEAIVVVYIRRILPGDAWSHIHSIDAVSNFLIKHKMLFIEQTREVSTIVILLTIAIMAGVRIKERIAYFLWVFGIWDIFYYIFLYIWLKWPRSIFDFDILFLIPSPWIAPCILPIGCSILFLWTALLLLKH
ncbi:MAG: hypothetical protein AB1630_08155 [bacterium]